MTDARANTAQAHLTALVDSIDDAVIATTPDGTIISWNAAAEEMFGYGISEVRGKSIAFLVSRDPARGSDILLPHVARGELRRHVEAVLVGKEHRAVNVSLTFAPIKDSSGGVATVLTIARDITRRKRGTDARLRMDRQLLTLHRLSEVMLSSRSFEESCLAVGKEIRTATGFPVVAVALYDEHRKVVVFHGLGDQTAGPGAPPRESPIDETLSGVVIRSGKPFIATHILSTPEYRNKAIARWAQAETYAGYPMKLGETITGCLNLAHTDVVEIGEDMTQWLESLANFLAVLLEQKRNEEELRTSREQLRELSRGIHAAIEDERKRIAREIHDNLGQELSLLQLELGLIQDQLPKAEKALRTKTKAMTRLIDSTIRSVQKISSDLRPTLLDNLGLGAAVEWAVRDFQKRTGLRCSISVDPPDLKLDPERSTAIFRIVQEALTNVLRHARATHVEVRLVRQEDAIALEVRDNGIGISPDRIADPKSIGLTGIRERVLPWEGKVTIHGKRGEGTDIIVTVPADR